MGKTTKHYSREFTIFRESSLVYGMMCYILWEISMNFKENYRNRKLWWPTNYICVFSGQPFLFFIFSPKCHVENNSPNSIFEKKNNFLMQ